MDRFSLVLPLLLPAALAGTVAGCGGDDDAAAPAVPRERSAGPPVRDAHHPRVQRAVVRHVERATLLAVERATGAYVDAEATGPATAECEPQGARRLSCVVAGYGQPGFSKFAPVQAHGPFRWRWRVAVDPASGEFRARPVEQQMPALR